MDPPSRGAEIVFRQNFARPRRLELYTLARSRRFLKEDDDDLPVADELTGTTIQTTTPMSTSRKHDFSGPLTPYANSPYLHELTKTPLLLKVFQQKKPAELLVSFMGLREVMGLVRVSKGFQAKIVKRILLHRRRQIVLAGLPQRTRIQLWRWVANKTHNTRGLFQNYKNRPNRAKGSILNDIKRTNGIYDLTSKQQKQMYSILNALSLCMPEVGYCQGLVFMSAVLLKSQLTEEECFRVLYSLMKTYEFSSVVACGFAKLKFLCYQFDCFLFANMREVSLQLQQSDFTADLYALRWLLTLFSYEMPTPYLNTLWDLFFLEKWKVMIRAGLAFVQVVNATCAKPNGCELFCLLRGINGDEEIARQVLHTMYCFKVTNRLMDQLLAFHQACIPPTLELISAAGERWWQAKEDKLDETLCMEDLGSPEAALSVYFKDADESRSPWECDVESENVSMEMSSKSMIVCGNCGSPSHSSMYCEKDTDDMSLEHDICWLLRPCVDTRFPRYKDIQDRFH